MAEYLLFGDGWNGEKISVPGEPLNMVNAWPRDKMKDARLPRKYPPRAINEILYFQVHHYMNGQQTILLGISDGVMPDDIKIQRAIALERPMPIGEV
ncbi:hypothetical protein [Serratia marcescens]|uniref:hypothetical protein n=1 Tax=Serratia marcescens TaxID=615 RepID=UPI00101FBD42|nr:hypothetical protein [Serratia marcescens]WIF05638.1 hypothetical protein QEP77_17155 [Serratia sp. B1]